MEAILQQIANLSVVVYILTTMLSMGLSFLPKQFLEPLRDKTLILKSLAANFLVVPLLTSSSSKSSHWSRTWLLGWS